MYRINSKELRKNYASWKSNNLLKLNYPPKALGKSSGNTAYYKKSIMT
jgi:hypothetical protein